MSSPGRTRVSSAALRAVHDRIERELADGSITAAQFALALDGEVVDARPFGAATTSSRFFIFSATKTLTATALLPHLADRTVELTAPVARYVPDFGANGKAEVTVLQLLTMQGGFPQAVMSRKRWGDRHGRLEQLAEWTLAYPAGTRTEYHPASAHWVIAELLETVAGRPCADLVHERVVAPAGAAPLLGAAAVDAGEPPTTIRGIGSYPDDRAALAATYGGAHLVPEATITLEGVLSMNDPRSWGIGIPGGGGISTATDMALVYQHLLHNSEGALPDEWLADARSIIRNGSVSASDKVPANRTLTGYISGVDGYHDHRWMPSAPRAFGHAGAGGQLCWVDPDSGVSIAFLHDTLNADPQVEFRRARDLHRLIVAAIGR